MIIHGFVGWLVGWLGFGGLVWGVCTRGLLVGMGYRWKMRAIAHVHCIEIRPMGKGKGGKNAPVDFGDVEALEVARVVHGQVAREGHRQVVAQRQELPALGRFEF